VLEESDGPGVEAGVDGNSVGEVTGGGVMDTERCIVAMWIVGRALARQKDDVLPEGCAGGRNIFALGGHDVSGVALSLASCFAFKAACSFFLSRSRSFFSLFLALLSSSSFSTTIYGGTPLSKLVRTSRGGRGSKAPAITEVALRRILFVGCIG